MRRGVFAIVSVSTAKVSISHNAPNPRQLSSILVSTAPADPAFLTEPETSSDAQDKGGASF